MSTDRGSRADIVAEMLKEPVVGNAAKQREAIAKCVNLITEFGNAEIVKTPLGVIIDIEAILKAALAAPPRNCDVGTAEEQSARWWKFCDRHFTYSPVAKDNCAKCPVRGTNRHCELAWAQMPYEEGDNDGSK